MIMPPSIPLKDTDLLPICIVQSPLPVILIIGGSLGANAINESIRQILPTLVKDYQVIHLCGKGNLDPSLDHIEGYMQFEYIIERWENE